MCISPLSRIENIPATGSVRWMRPRWGRDVGGHASIAIEEIAVVPDWLRNADLKVSRGISRARRFRHRTATSGVLSSTGREWWVGIVQWDGKTVGIHCMLYLFRRSRVKIGVWRLPVSNCFFFNSLGLHSRHGLLFNTSPSLTAEELQHNASVELRANVTEVTERGSLVGFPYTDANHLDWHLCERLLQNLDVHIININKLFIFSSSSCWTRCWCLFQAQLLVRTVRSSPVQNHNQDNSYTK